MLEFEETLGFASMTAATPFRQPIPPAPAADAPSYTPGGISSFQRFGFNILVLYLFLIYSRIFDVKFAFLHIPGISYRVIFAMVILSQAFVRALKTDVGKAMAGFTFWFVAAIPFSMWKGGSTDLLINSWLPNMVVFLATAGLVANYSQCRKAVVTVAIGFLVLTAIAILLGSTESTGRLYLPNGKYANPNEMGQALLLGLSLWLFLLLDSRSAAFKAFAGTVILVMLFTISKTGSRGCLIGFGVLLLAVFLRSSPSGRLQLMLGGGLLIAIIVGTMPSRLLNRYRTLTEDQDQVLDASEESAYSSTNARKDLLRKSIKYTLQHPIFGVGPGMFPVAEDADARANEGRRHGRWQGTHNSYTEVSSELGIPGLIFYAAAIFLALRKTERIYRKTRGDPRLTDIANLALGLNYALIVYAVTVLFDYIAYSSMLSVFAGLATALSVTVEAEIARRTAAPPPVAAAPQPVAPPVRGFRTVYAGRY